MLKCMIFLYQDGISELCVGNKEYEPSVGVGRALLYVTFHKKRIQLRKRNHLHDYVEFTNCAQSLQFIHKKWARIVRLVVTINCISGNGSNL